MWQEYCGQNDKERSVTQKASGEKCHRVRMITQNTGWCCGDNDDDVELLCSRCCTMAVHTATAHHRQKRVVKKEEATKSYIHKPTQAHVQCTYYINSKMISKSSRWKLWWRHTHTRCLKTIQTETYRKVAHFQMLMANGETIEVYNVSLVSPSVYLYLLLRKNAAEYCLFKLCKMFTFLASFFCSVRRAKRTREGKKFFHFTPKPINATIFLAYLRFHACVSEGKSR